MYITADSVCAVRRFIDIGGAMSVYFGTENDTFIIGTYEEIAELGYRDVRETTKQAIEWAVRHWSIDLCQEILSSDPERSEKEHIVRSIVHARAAVCLSLMTGWVD